MSKSIIQDLQDMISNAFEKEESIGLDSLLWSIDSRHRVILMADEINLVLENFDNYEINRTEGNVFISPSKKTAQDKILNSDIDIAHESYIKVLTGAL